MKIEAYLLSGAGNQFLIINSDEFKKIENKLKSLDDKNNWIKSCCQIANADGLIFLKKNQIYNWDFYNNDGSVAEMCGNATRCVGWYISEILQDNEKIFYLQTVAGEIEIVKKSSKLYEIQMTEVKLLQSAKGFYCNTGVPHLVIKLEKFEDYKKNKSMAQQLRHDVEFMPKGTNVTFIAFDNYSTEAFKSMKAISFERGVEDFTQACGTGAMAAAYYNLVYNKISQTVVQMPGGELRMNLTNLQKPIMIGPVEFVKVYNFEVSET